MKRQQYTVEFLTVPVDGFTFGSNCADITFKNFGVEQLIVNDVVPLSTGDFITVAGNVGEIDRTKYHVKFTTGVGTKIAVIIKRNYLGE